MEHGRRLRVRTGMGILMVAAALAGAWGGQRSGPQQSEAPDAATVALQRLGRPVRVVEDRDGAVHIFAAADRDAFFVQGFLHARDRFFQMDATRRLFSGRLAELVGGAALAQDVQLRTLGFRRAAEETWKAMPSPAQGRLRAYAEGVNAFLESGAQLPAEYGLLELSQAAPWTPVDTLTVLKGVLFARSLDFAFEIEVTLALDDFQVAGQSRGFDGSALFFEDIYRVAPFDPVATVPGIPEAQKGSVPIASIRKGSVPNIQEGSVPNGMTVQEGSVPNGMGSVPNVRETLGTPTLVLARRLLGKLASMPGLERLLSSFRRGQGSNWWVLSGSLTQSGRPLLAGDPHLDLTQPGLWYENHLVVQRDPVEGALDVNGVSVPGIPSVAIGCNPRLCWSITTNPADVADTFRETLTLDASGLPSHTLFRGQQEAIQRIPQTFRLNLVGNGVSDDFQTVAPPAASGGATFIVPRRNAGPLVDFAVTGPGAGIGLSVQQTGARVTRELESLFRLARADSFESFSKALDLFDTPFNFAYADVNGNIGYVASGEIPLREDLQNLERVDGMPPFLIRDGSGAALNEWIAAPDDPPASQALPFAVLPRDEMPHSFNPAQGYLANCNNDPVGLLADNDAFNRLRPGGGAYYLLWLTLSLRAAKVNGLIQEQAAQGIPFDLDRLGQMQSNSQFADVEVLLPHLLQAFQNAMRPDAPSALTALANDTGVGEAIQRLSEWDFTSPTGIQQGFDAGDDPAALPAPSPAEIAASVAATLYAAWRSEMVQDVLDATLARNEINRTVTDFAEIPLKAVRRLLEEFPQGQGRGSSGLDFFAGQGGPTAPDNRDLLLLRSLRGALDRLAGPSLAAAFRLSRDQDDYRWGRLHRLVLSHPLGAAFSVPPTGGLTHLAPGLPGIPRPGGYETVDNGPDGILLFSANSFLYDTGASPRLLAELDPEGIQARIALAGGQSQDPSSPHYADQLRLWLTNQYHPLRSDLPAIQQAQESETVFAPTELRFAYPIDEANQGRFTAFAVANASQSPLEMAFTFNGPVGPQIESPLLLAPGTQSARLGREIFAATPLPRRGWVELTAFLDEQAALEPPVVATFTQLGDFAFRSLDGSVAVEQPASRLFFTRIYQGEGALRGQDARTTIHLANPGEEPIQAHLQLIKPDGSSSTAERQIPALQAMSEAVDSLFPQQPLPLIGGYIRVDIAEGLQATGTLLVEVGEGDSLLLLNAAAGNPALLSYSAQLAAAPGIFTSLKLVNTSQDARQVTLSAISAQGSLLATPVVQLLPPGASLEFEPLPHAGSETPTLIGSLRVESDGAGVIGDVVFGDPSQAAFVAALPLQSQTLHKGLFPHLANLSGFFFTGVALHNPSDQPSEVVLEAFAPDGQSLGTVELILAPQARLSRTVEELIPETAGQQGGFLIIQSQQPIVAQVLFGTNNLSLLSAVPATVIE